MELGKGIGSMNQQSTEVTPQRVAFFTRDRSVKIQLREITAEEIANFAFPQTRREVIGKNNHRHCFACGSQLGSKLEFINGVWNESWNQPYSNQEYTVWLCGYDALCQSSHWNVEVA